MKNDFDFDDALEGAEFEDTEREAIQAIENELPPLRVMTADEILTTEFPEPIWAIPELLPAGLSIIAGRAKLGKSWLALQIALGVASGGTLFDKPIDKGRVLYLALEDNNQRIQKRTRIQGWPPGLGADFITMRGENGFTEQIGYLNKGGTERLTKQLDHGNYSLLIIDTLSRSISGDQNDIVAMTMALQPLQKLAHENNLAVVFIDHHKKLTASPDMIADILGSTGKGAVSDCIWGLYRERGKTGAKLAITGRDVEETTLDIEIDWITGAWQLQNSVEQQSDIFEYLRNVGPAGCTDIANALDKDKSNIYRKLSDLTNENKIIKTGYGRGKVKYSVFDKDL